MNELLQDLRVALAASGHPVPGLVTGQTGAGIATRLLLSFFAGRVLGGLLFGLSPRDPETALGGPAVWLLVSVGPDLKPAGRAAHGKPTRSLLAE